MDVKDMNWDRLARPLPSPLCRCSSPGRIAIPIGVYSATRQYFSRYTHHTVFGFICKGIPEFMLAHMLMWLGYAYFNMDVGGFCFPSV